MDDFESAFAALTGLTNYETMVRPAYSSRAMNLPRTRALLKKLGSPERSFPVLQVAGTKGKGTAATALAAMIEASGRRVGLYTSPHLFSVRERMAVNGRWISEERFAAAVGAILPHITPLRGRPECPTFFELITALALHHFREEAVDAAVLEVGLGGRLDATSAVRPVASLITQVGLDHTAILGRTKGLIAREKAGVAKRGVPLLSGVPARLAAARAIAEVAAEKGAPLSVTGRDFAVTTGRPQLLPRGPRTPVRVVAFGGLVVADASVLGRDLARDAGLAAALLLHPRVRRRLPVGEGAMARGLSRLSVPGRIQVVPGRPTIVVDGAHNPDSTRSLVATLTEALEFRRVVAVVGGGVDKQVESIAAILGGFGPSTRFVFTKPATHPRAADPRALAAAVPNAGWCRDLPAALARARREAAADDLVVVTGSLYLAGEALNLLKAVCGGSGPGCPPPAGTRGRR